MSKKYYAVKAGHQTGIFTTWAACSKQVHGFGGAMYKAFDDKESAEEYMKVNKASFSELHDSEDEITEKLRDGEALAYVDGSNTGDGETFSWGIVMFTKEGKVNLSGKSNDKRFVEFRNISGELFASVNAINYAIQNRMTKISIYHDYSGIRHWALGEWKTKNELSKVYRAFCKNAMTKIDIEFVKAAGHTGDKFNEEADVLAKAELGITKKSPKKKVKVNK